MKNLWEIQGFEDCFGYLISETGLVYSKKTEKFLAVLTNKKGYQYTILNVCGKRKHVFVHRLVWAYHNGKFPEKLQINHKDGDKKNNDISNLEVVTGSENMLHSYRTGLHQKKASPGCIAPVISISKCGEKKYYPSIREASKAIKRSDSSISKVCKGKACSCGGFLWKYALDGVMQ